MKIFTLSLWRLLIGLIVFVPAAAWSADGDDDAKKNVGTFELKFENDLFSGQDQNYTNGIRLSYLSPQGNTFEPLEDALGFLNKKLNPVSNSKDNDSKVRTTRLGLALGHEIYTPEDRYRTDLIVDDRPYSAWLYGGMSVHVVTDFKDERGNSKRKNLESIELDIGVVGPSAAGEELQNFVHEVRLIDTFDGWDNQLNDEIGVALHYERKWRLFNPIAFGAMEFDAIPNAGASLGNVLTQAHIGGAIRLGKNLPDDFGPPSLIQGGTTFDRKPDEPYSAYLFAATQGRAVAHNIFLDGNTFDDSHSVEKETFVGDLSLGVAFLYGRFKISYANAFRTKEFEGQQRISRFGSLTASMQF